MPKNNRVDAESESGDSVVILRSDPGETVGMTRDRAFYLAQRLDMDLASSRIWVWQNSVGCKYKKIRMQ